jgi:hypothetical protein
MQASALKRFEERFESHAVASRLHGFLVSLPSA